MSKETLLDLKLLAHEPPYCTAEEVKKLDAMPDRVLFVDKLVYQVLYEERRLLIEALNALPGGSFVAKAIKAQAIASVCSGDCETPPMITVAGGGKP